MKFFIRSLLLLVLSPLAFAVPGTINYQGRLLDNNGIPVTGSYNFVLSIWSTASGATGKLYQENHNAVAVDDGVYSFEIGGGTSQSPAWNPTSLFNTTAARYVELTVNGETLTPRHRLLSAPFTLQSGNSDALGGQGINYFGTAAQVNSLQNQINNLSGQLGALQAICEMNHGIWDGSTCVPTIAVLRTVEGDDTVPISQLRRLWVGLGESEMECAEPHYHAYPDPSKGIVPVKTCKGNTFTQEPDSRGCAFGKESEVIYIETFKCEAFLKGGGK